MASVEISPPEKTAPVSYDFLNKTFIPSTATYNKFDVYFNSNINVVDHITAEGNSLRYDDATKTYNGNFYSDNQLPNTIKLKDALLNDKLRKRYYTEYVLNAEHMYDINQSEDVNDYINFLKDNPVLVETIYMFNNWKDTYAPVYYIENLNDCATFLVQLRNASGSNSIPYKNVRKLHEQLVDILHTMDEIEFHVEVNYKNATLNDIHARKYISLNGLDFNNLHMEWLEYGDDADDAYPIIRLKGCDVSGKIISDYHIRQLCAEYSNIGGFELGNHCIFGTYLKAVNVESGITLPNCSQSVFVCALDTKVNLENYKQMINFSKRHIVKIFTKNSFLSNWKKIHPKNNLEDIENIYLFNADFNPYDTNRYNKAKSKLDCDAFIISDDPKVEAFKYEKYIEANNDLPREMIELFISLLSK